FIDHTYLHFSGFADNARGQWNTALAEQFGLDPALLPRIVAPHDSIGEVSASVAAQCGLKAGTPVVAGCGDTAASFLACGATEEGICVDVAGTASVFAATTSSYRPDGDQKILACSRSATPDLWHSYAYINGGGMNLEWFRQEIANGGAAETREGITFEDLEGMAAAVLADEEAPLFVPHLEGRVCPSEPNLRGAWVGLTRGSSLGALYRAVLESVALEYGLYERAILALYPDFRSRELRITGGGERSALWNQIKADALNMSVVQVQGGGGAPLGAAMLACLGTGVHQDLPSAAAEWIETGQRFAPNSNLSHYYQKRIDRYQAALGAVRELSS
ncbi:MAG: FGGY-family carbohydrate kinase, partial [Armatimonadota bacterium]|nr:FGGY-family carbohydrate kinase [Armatimonadota bacterium]